MVSVTLPSTHSFTMWLFSSPPCQQIDFLSSKNCGYTHRNRTDRSVVDGAEILDASLREPLSSKISRVVEFRRDPGSLKAILPTRPMPNRAISIPPKLSMRCSYRRQYSKDGIFGNRTVRSKDILFIDIYMIRNISSTH